MSNYSYSQHHVHTLFRCCHLLCHSTDKLTDHFSHVWFNEFWVHDCRKSANWSNKKCPFKSISALKSALATNFTSAIWHFQAKLDIREKMQCRMWKTTERETCTLHLCIWQTFISKATAFKVYILLNSCIAWESNLWLCVASNYCLSYRNTAQCALREHIFPFHCIAFPLFFYVNMR